MGCPTGGRKTHVNANANVSANERLHVAAFTDRFAFANT